MSTSTLVYRSDTGYHVDGIPARFLEYGQRILMFDEELVVTRVAGNDKFYRITAHEVSTGNTYELTVSNGDIMYVVTN